MADPTAPAPAPGAAPAVERRTVPRYGARVRALRLRAGLTQAALARQLGVSASYLNLIERDRRPLPAELLLRLAQALDVDLRAFAAAGDDARLAGDLAEVFGDAVFEDYPVTRQELGEFAAAAPGVARAVVALHQAYAAARANAEALAERVLDTQDAEGAEGGPAPDGGPRLDHSRLSTEQVSDLLQQRGNHFPALEAAAERLRHDAGLGPVGMFGGLARHLGRAHGVAVRIATVGEMRGAVRRYDPLRRELLLSEVLHRGSRNFQAAVQLALLAERDALDAAAAGAPLGSAEARTLARLALASYFAGAVLMPYAEFLAAAEETRYDVELLGHRFRVGWEQTCHRLTTLGRPGAEGVRFYLVRVDLAGNISKKFSAAGIRFPRFSGLCALWNVHAAFLQPGVVRAQLSRLPDGAAVFAVARTVRRQAGDYHAPPVLHAVGIGCDLESARRLVYADGVELDRPGAGVPIGVTCRLCERRDCRARAFPPVHAPLRVDADVRGVSFYAPAE
jgi:predicted transcriptional regulator/transcriptional regulator with XRE-family HTH domain